MPTSKTKVTDLELAQILEESFTGNHRWNAKRKVWMTALACYGVWTEVDPAFRPQSGKGTARA